MTASNPVIITQIVGFGGFTWVALYLLVRTTRLTPPMLISILALLSLGVFFGYNALNNALLPRQVYINIERWFWWSTTLPTALWFHFSSLIKEQIRHAEVTSSSLVISPWVLLVYVWAGGMIVAGTTTNLFIDYSSVTRQPGGMFYIYPGSAYLIYIAFNGVVTLGALLNFVLALRHLRQTAGPDERTLRQQLQLLTIGAVLFLIGALWLSIRYNWALPVPLIPGYLVLFIGLGVLAYTVAQFGMLLEGQNIRRDFFYNLTGVLLLNLLYVGLLMVAGQESLPMILALVALVTLTHTVFDNGRTVLDRFFFSSAERTARAEAREYATALGTRPVSLPTFAERTELIPESSESTDEDAEVLPDATEEEIPNVPKHFKDSVRRAVTNLKSPPQLAKSPLLSLKLIDEQLNQSEQEDNRLNRAAILRELLIEQIEALQPNDSASSPTGEAWRFYNVLYYPYVREISRKGALAEMRRLQEIRQRIGQHTQGTFEEVLNWLTDIDENTFYKWQRRASDTIATILWEANQKVEKSLK
jgi:hypothetical protein